MRAPTVARWVSYGLRAGHVRLGGETVTYDGFSVVRHEPGQPDDETWVPVGDEPSGADDEAMIAAMREALRWEVAGHMDSTGMDSHPTPSRPSAVL